jgi:hypothetical protein
VTRAGRSRGHLYVRKPDAVLVPVFATTPGDQASPRVAVVLDRDEHQGLPNHMDVQGQRDGGLDRMGTSIAARPRRPPRIRGTSRS